MSSRILARCLVLVVLFVTLANQTTPAADDATNSDPEIAAAKRAQALAEAKAATAKAEADLAKAEADKAKAMLGEITQTTPKGTATAEGLSVEGKIRAYRAAETAATAIAEAVLKKSPQKVVVFSAKEMNDITFWQSFLQQATVLQNQLAAPTLPPLFADNPGQCAPPKTARGVPPAVRTVPPLMAIDAALQLLSLFKVDRTVKGADVTLDDFAIAALVGGKLAAAKISVAYPPSYYPGAFAPSSAPRTTQALATLTQRRQTLIDFSTNIDTKKQQIAQRSTQEQQQACKDRYAEDIALLDNLQTRVKTSIGLLDAFFAGILKADAQSGVTLLQTLIAAEQLSTTFQSAHTLQLKPVAAGGATMTTTNIFGSKISFSGGVVISYMLFDSAGVLVDAATVPQYGGFVDEKEMQ